MGFIYSFGQDSSEVKVDNPSIAADTTGFSPNKSAGWSTLCSYMSQDTKDSINMELVLILKPENGRMGGSDEKLIGSITNKSFLPQKNQVVPYDLLSDNKWNLRITTSGECYLVQVKGYGVRKSELQGNPDMIPIKIKYSSN